MSGRTSRTARMCSPMDRTSNLLRTGDSNLVLAPGRAAETLRTMGSEVPITVTSKAGSSAPSKTPRLADDPPCTPASK